MEWDLEKTLPLTESKNRAEIERRQALRKTLKLAEESRGEKTHLGIKGKSDGRQVEESQIQYPKGGEGPAKRGNEKQQTSGPKTWEYGDGTERAFAKKE